MTLNERYNGVIAYFRTHVPDAETELKYSNPYELIVAVILSAQCTDKRINQITPKLFTDFPTVEVLAASNADTVFSYIRSVSYPNNKAKHLVNMANMLLHDFDGVIPSDINELIKLPGVGRKTANVVASVIYDKPAMAVDTHVFRVSNRIGLTKAKNALQSELQLIKHVPKEFIAIAHHWLILHGRYICVARNPKCEICPLTRWCQFFKTKIVNKNFPHSLAKKTNSMNRAAAGKLSAKKSVLKKEIIVPMSNIKSKDESYLKEKSIPKKAVAKIILAAGKIKTVGKDKFVAHTTSLKKGDKAPAFSAKDQHGKTISLSGLKGKKIVLYFYPKDNTPGCTFEACSLRDEHAYLIKKNYVVIGVSADNEQSHLKFATKFDLPFSLLVDTDMTIIKKYEVWGIKQFMGKIYDGIIRTTFIINETGIISEVIRIINTKEHGKQIAAL